jgi:hypothetical protein
LLLLGCSSGGSSPDFLNRAPSATRTVASPQTAQTVQASLQPAPRSQTPIPATTASEAATAAATPPSAQTSTPSPALLGGAAISGVGTPAAVEMPSPASAPPSLEVASPSPSPAPPTVPTQPPPAPPASGAAQLQAVNAFYRAVQARDFSGAYALLGPAFRVNNPYADFAAGYATTLSFDFTATPTADPTTVQVDITAVDGTPQSGAIQRRFSGVWHLVPGTGAGWLLNTASFSQVGPVVPVPRR